MTKKILIANRGEIAVRIIRAAKILSFKTVALYSKEDVESLHVKIADEAWYLGEGSLFETYLNIDKILSIAERTGSDGVHPGYGFLSENHLFAKSVLDAGMEFVGPSPKAMKTLGNKVEAIKLAKKAGLPTNPGSGKIIKSVASARKIAARIGYPIILKAVHGGGGMGMRKVDSEEELENAFVSASEQAKAAFGSGELFLEKYIENPRHIEIQFLADKHGEIIHLGERECSIQRRHQKLIEESPSVVLTEQARQEIGELVKKLGRLVGYENAGTAEFLYKEGMIYFNEVNPRIQVEHPVTEMVTGVDLVKEQLLIAFGHPLSKKQEDIQLRGHAMELRINAENPLNDFAPTPGLISEFMVPLGQYIRFDTHLYKGYTVPATFDSLIGKLIAWGENREMARRKLLMALDELTIAGIQTNVELHRIMLKHPKFITGKLSTNFIQENKIIEKLRSETLAKLAALFALKLKSSKVVLPKRNEQAWSFMSRQESVGEQP